MPPAAVYPPGPSLSEEFNLLYGAYWLLTKVKDEQRGKAGGGGGGGEKVTLLFSA